MPKTYFIADVHLSSDQPGHDTPIMHFLDLVIQNSGDLYILGDFFDFWANNRCLTHRYRPVLSMLRTMTEQGSRIALVHGNRDFLLSRKALIPFGITYLGEEAVVTLDSMKILLTHGHLLCTDDLHFFRYRRYVWPLFRALDFFLPGRLENYVAQKCILRSKKSIRSRSQSELRFSRSTLISHFSRGINVIICGHAHREEYAAFGENLFYALPNWEREQGAYLLYENGSFSLNPYP